MARNGWKDLGEARSKESSYERPGVEIGRCGRALVGQVSFGSEPTYFGLLLARFLRTARKSGRVASPLECQSRVAEQAFTFMREVECPLILIKAVLHSA